MRPRHPEPRRALLRGGAAALLLAGLLAGGGPAAAAPMGEEQLGALMERIGRGGDRRAAFTSRKTVAALNQPITTSGTLVFRRPSYFEKNTTAPRPERVVVDGSTVSIDTGEGARSFSLSSQPGLRTLIDTFRGALSGDLATLQRSYAVRGDTTGRGWRLLLTPVDGGLGRFVRAVEIRGSGGTPRTIAIVQGNGDSEVMTLGAR